MNAQIDITDIVLVTERLIIRPWRMSDLSDFYEYASVDGVGQMAGWLPHKDIEESRRILQMFMNEKKTFALEYKGKVIGSLGIEQYNENELPEFEEGYGREIGYVLSKEYWGQGLMPEAVEAVINYLFEKQGLDFLICCHYTTNDQSRRVQEKCGFVHYKLVQSRTGYGERVEQWVSVLKKSNN